MPEIIENKCVTLIKLKSPFKLTEYDKEVMTWEPTKTIREYIPVIKSDIAEVEFVASVNGKAVDEAEWDVTYLMPDDNIIICPIVGKSGKNIFKMLALIAVAIIAPQIGFAAASAMEGTALGVAGGLAGSVFGSTAAFGSFLGTVVGFVGTSLVNSLMPNTAQKSDSSRAGDSLGGSPSYGYDGPKNASAEGVPVPVVYGMFRMGGNLVNAYTQNISDKQFLYLLYAMSEGPISGINTIFLNEQPITSFDNVATEIRMGTPSQPIMGWFGDTYTPRAINLKLNTGWTEYTTLDEVDKLRFDVTFPAGLFRINTKKGHMMSQVVTLYAQYRKVGEEIWQSLGNNSVVDYYDRRYIINGVDMTTLPTGLIDGKTLVAAAAPTNRYGMAALTQQTSVSVLNWGGVSGYGTAVFNANTVYKKKPNSYSNPFYSLGGSPYNVNDYVAVGTAYDKPIYKAIIEITGATRSTIRRSFTTPQLPEGKYEVRMRRAVAESIENNVSDGVYFSELNEIVTDDVQYNNTAMLGIRVQMSDQLNGVPKMTALVNGVKIRTWDEVAGVWEVETSNNPAWILLDMMTNPRYGAGIEDDRLDMERFKEWAVHCEQYNLTFDGVFDTALTLWDAMQYVLRCGHAQIVSVGTRYTIAIERAEAASMMFSVTNMVEGSFSINWLPLADRANEIDVSYFDAQDGFKQHTVKVVDAEAISNGVPPKSTSITLFGVIDAQRAYNEGLVQLAMNKYILQTVTFDASIDAIACTVGDVIYVQHDMPQWGYAGRLDDGSTSNLVKLDRPVNIQAGKSYRLLLMFDALLRASGTIYNIIGNSVYLTGFDGNTAVKRLVAVKNNLLDYAEETDNGYWGKVNATVVKNARIAPNGSLTAEGIVAAVGTGVPAPHYYERNMLGLVAGKSYSYSIHMHPGASRHMSLYVYGVGNALIKVSVDAVTKQVTGLSNDGTGLLSNYGATEMEDGWWRLWMTGYPDSAATNRRFRVTLFNDSNVGSFIGDGTTVQTYVWGAMVAEGTALQPVVPYEASIDRQALSVFDAGSGNYGVVLDDVAGLNVGQTYRLYDTDVLLERDVVNSGQGETTDIPVVSPFPNTPAYLQQFMFGENTKMKKPFRVRSISGTGDYSRTITAIEYNESIYDGDPSKIIPTPNYSDLQSGPVQSVTIQGVAEDLYRIGSNFGVRATISYTSDSETYKEAEVFVSRNGGTMQRIGNDYEAVTIETSDDEVLEFTVVAYDILGRSQSKTEAAKLTYTVVGKKAPPEDVKNFAATVNPVDISLTWDAVSDADLAGYEIRSGTSWDSATVLVTGLAATKFTDDKEQAGIYTYLIRAIDTSGNYSQNVTATSVTLVQPEPVSQFAVIQSGTRLEFRWKRNPEPSIVSYEIREGNAWNVSSLVCQTDSTTYTIPAGAAGTRTFWIKAIAAPGIYGQTAVFANTSIAMPSNRNLLVTLDKQDEGFAGLKHFCGVTAGALQMDLNTMRSEYIFDIDLGDSYRAQNTLFTSLFAANTDDTTWSEASFAWNAPDARRRWVPTADEGGVSARYQIALPTGLEATELYGWRLNNDLLDVNGVAPSESLGVTYDEGRYSSGLYITDVTTVSWPLTLPQQFNYVFWIKPYESLSAKFLTFSNVMGNTLQFGYDNTQHKFYLEDELGRRLECLYDFDESTLICVGIVQNLTNRKLFVGNMTGLIVSDEQNFAAPADGYTKLAMY